MSKVSLVSLIVLAVAVFLVACSPTETLVATPTNTPAVLAPSATPENPTPTPTPEKKAEPTMTPTPEQELPSAFSLLLVFDADTQCGYDGFEFVYDVTLADDSITLYQVAADITLTGPYDSATGEFTAIVTGLPGTETFTGVVSPGDAPGTVVMSGTYTYGDDPNVTCEGLWPFLGSTQ